MTEKAMSWSGVRGQSAHQSQQEVKRPSVTDKRNLTTPTPCVYCEAAVTGSKVDLMKRLPCLLICFFIYRAASGDLRLPRVFAPPQRSQTDRFAFRCFQRVCGSTEIQLHSESGCVQSMHHYLLCWFLSPLPVVSCTDMKEKRKLKLAGTKCWKKVIKMEPSQRDLLIVFLSQTNSGRYCVCVTLSNTCVHVCLNKSAVLPPQVQLRNCSELVCFGGKTQQNYGF